MTFQQYLEQWLKHLTPQGMNNPLVKMPIKRFRLLTPTEFNYFKSAGKIVVGTMSDPITRNLHKNFLMRMRERGEHAAYWTYGSVELTITASTIGNNQQNQNRKALFPVLLKKVSLKLDSHRLKAEPLEDEVWLFNPVLSAHLKSFGLNFSSTESLTEDVVPTLKAQLGNRGEVKTDSYIGLFSSQQMVVRERLADPLLRNFLALNPVVRAKVQGEKVSASSLGEISDDGLEDLGLVLPCDDSQLRVIQISDQNVSLQVEGPPGTGKSQTIANIIGNALWRGKRILFVCDKKVAITQVEDRLTDSGLGAAILNLHDEDLDKRAFLEYATKRFSTRQSQNWYPFERLKETRQILNQRVKYSRAIAHPSAQITQREALSGLIRLRRELKNVPNINISNWRDLAQERLQKILRDVATWPSMQEVLTNSQSAWNRVRVEAFSTNPNAKNEISIFLGTLLKEISYLDELREIYGSVGVVLDLKSLEDIKRIENLSDMVLSRPICYPHIVGNTKLSVSKVLGLKKEWQRREKVCLDKHPLDLKAIDPEIILKKYEDIWKNHYKGSMEFFALTWEGLVTEIAKKEEALKLIERMQSIYEELCKRFGLIYSESFKRRMTQIDIVMELLNIGGSVPRSWWNQNVSPVVVFEQWKAGILKAVEHASRNDHGLNYVALERVASNRFCHVEAQAEHGFNLISYVLNYVDDRKCKIALKQTYSRLPKKLKSENWHDVTLHAVEAKDILHGIRTSSESHLILKQMATTFLNAPIEAEEWLKQDKIQTIEKLAMLVEQYRGRSDLFNVSDEEWQSFWELQDGGSCERLKEFKRSLEGLVSLFRSQDGVGHLLLALTTDVEKMKEFITTYCQAGDRSKHILASINAAKVYQETTRNLNALNEYELIQPDCFNNPKWDELETVFNWRDEFEKLRGNFKLDIESSLWKLIKDSSIWHLTRINDALNGLSNFFVISKKDVVGYVSVKEWIADISGELNVYPLWVEKKKWVLKIPAYPEIKDLWEKVVDGQVKSTEANRLFIFNFLLLCDPIAQPTGEELRQTIESFVNQDGNLENWSIERLKNVLIERTQEAIEKYPMESGELERISAMQRPRGTVRELLNKHIQCLLESKPCWMMSPTSLANLVDFASIFKGKEAPFDMVIFDEASQIRVADGLLSMAFGKQAIIVGDRNQLPPTDFFSSVFAEEGEEGADWGLSESLLEEFAGVFEDGTTHAMLMCHYRSETPDLIRFSNDYFYKGKLEMYPPSHVSGIGRKKVYVDGTFSANRNNEKEADEVLRLIEAHVKDCSDKSLGVVTMNIPQMELIDEKIQNASQAVKAFCYDDKKFFLRNLETVQGDEMDRIILSLTYGKNEKGNFNASILGPLLKSGGERRLNVAITRSRSGMIVVTSLKTSDLEATGGQSKGFNCFKEFLYDLDASARLSNYGMTSERFKKKDDGVSNIIFCESPFEEEVVSFLENSGYEIECQYGCGGFRIDLIVKERGKNLLAVECDGAAYHSSLVARTRDRARQRILEGRGWRVHRVWSTNWWYFEEQEKVALLEAIQSARGVGSR